jgi:hypothetical protein
MDGALKRTGEPEFWTPPEARRNDENGEAPS